MSKTYQTDDDPGRSPSGGYLWAVRSIRGLAGPKAEEVEEYYTAYDIRDVITTLATDLECQATEIISITRHVPVLGSIPPGYPQKLSPPVIEEAKANKRKR